MAIHYCHNNYLTINETKTNQLIVGRHNKTIGRLPDLIEVFKCILTHIFSSKYSQLLSELNVRKTLIFLCDFDIKSIVL